MNQTRTLITADKATDDENAKRVIASAFPARSTISGRLVEHKYIENKKVVICRTVRV